MVSPCFWKISQYPTSVDSMFCPRIDYKISNTCSPIMYANPQGNIEEKLKQAWIRAGNAVKLTPQISLPNTSTQLYGSIKSAGDTCVGVITQCIQAIHMLQAKKLYCANVCLQINMK